jgi:hypothetical protein
MSETHKSHSEGTADAISAEITAQLMIFRKQMNKEWLEDIAAAHKHILANVSKRIDQAVEVKMAAFEQQMDTRIERAVARTESRMDSRVGAEVDKSLREAMPTIRTAVNRDITTKMAESNSKIVLANNSQMQLQMQQSQQKTLAMVERAKEEIKRELTINIAQAVYAEITDEINQTIKPQVDKMMAKVEYHTADDAELVHQYRRAVNAQANPDGGQLRLTDGSRDSHYVAPYVSVFFGDGD